MRIFVCVKAVPDTASRIKVGGDGKSVDQGGLKWTLGPYDARCVIKAVQLKEQHAGSEVVAVSSGFGSGDREAKKRIKDALALGCDRGIWIADDQAENRDNLLVAKALAEAIKAEGQFDLVLLGRQAVDDQALATGPMLATLLGVPCVTDAVGLEVANGVATVTRAAEGRQEKLEVKLPAVVTGQRDLADEVYPKLKEILAAGKKKIEDKKPAWPEPHYLVTKLSPPPERQAGKIVGEGPDAVPALLDLLQNEAKKLSF